VEKHILSTFSLDDARGQNAVYIAPKIIIEVLWLYETLIRYRVE
jgi:hypothetical protein